MPRVAADTHCELGENPLWVPDDEVVYWVDITEGELLEYELNSGQHRRVFNTDIIGGMTSQSDGTLLLFEDGGRVEVFTGSGTETIIDRIPAERDTRFNDVVADPRGRVFCGTMPTEDDTGSLYRLDRDGEIRRVLDDVALPNGMGFSPDRERFYLTESDRSRIYRYDYDVSTGALSNPECLVDVSDETGVPDGLTVDREGYIWSARWDGGCVVRYDTQGRETRRLSFPAKKVSSVTFGGADLTTMYVTTALVGGTRDEEGEGAGALMAVETDAVGETEYRSRICI